MTCIFSNSKLHKIDTVIMLEIIKLIVYAKESNMSRFHMATIAPGNDSQRNYNYVPYNHVTKISVTSQISER